MYEDSWYNFVPDVQNKKASSSQVQGTHRRKESLLQQPNGPDKTSDVASRLAGVNEESEDDSPPEPALSRRAKSYSDFYDIVREHLADNTPKKSKKRKQKKQRSLEGLAVPESAQSQTLVTGDGPFDADAWRELEDELLQASQGEYATYRDKLALTERHLDTLIEDTDGALKILASLAESFRAVEEQTSSFKAQCDDLLSEQRRLEKIADDVRSDFYYYAYLEEVTRRLNAPGASRLADGAPFAEMLTNLEACIEFMSSHPTYRDAESYQARYQALLTKALHLLEVGFTALLDKVSGEISKQIAATQSESARHALAYGRFEEMMLDSYSLIPNIQKVVGEAYDRLGNPKSGLCAATYANTADNMFRSYLSARELDLKPLSQADVETLKKEAAEESVETASRNYVKQCFERSHNELLLFARVFGLEPQYSTDQASAFATIKAHRGDAVSAINVAPIATNLQAILAPVELQILCEVIGWMTDEYLTIDYDEIDESDMSVALHRQEMTARVLGEHLWQFADGVFEAEVAKLISKAPVVPESLKIEPVAAGGGASSNAYPPVKTALRLLVLFDQCMPKERCQGSSPVVFKIVKESIAALHRAEARIKSIKNGTDADLFMIKNLLILKNELMTLEIGDVRDGQGAGMEHFGQIWNTLSAAQDWVGYFSSFIPGASLFSRGSPAPGGGGTTPTLRASGSGAQAGGNGAQTQDAGEQLDKLLRQSIYAFTRRWGALVNEAQSRSKLGGKNMAKVERELEELLQTAFSNQPEVIAKLKEAIQINAQALGEKGSKVTRPFGLGPHRISCAGGWGLLWTTWTANLADGIIHPVGVSMHGLVLHEAVGPLAAAIVDVAFECAVRLEEVELGGVQPRAGLVIVLELPGPRQPAGRGAGTGGRSQGSWVVELRLDQYMCSSTLGENHIQLKWVVVGDFCVGS
ncbi:hypothetical protein OOU_Y34scaffold00126g103 [Pyricularia oryzae Y34]|uniref:Conserved oligomeric Golgi complex subunit 3 n=1 Tax=Pyricularia oryzae (strain Y34) TaxID=1143189 RepID=A0AA97P8G6_PYRO3|nr:hypothetical protein OOU_Y34scaffold00126g103 [Pyricularia oryzae Y34]